MTAKHASTTPTLNGTRIKRLGETILIPLPKIMWRTAGKCECNVCKGKEGFWDTLAVSQDPHYEHTWTVHAPELQPRSEN